jgi:hypothetical protein
MCHWVARSQGFSSDKTDEWVAALAARNPAQAHKAMREHLQKAHDRWALDPDRGAETGFDDGARPVSIEGAGAHDYADAPIRLLPRLT